MNKLIYIGITIAVLLTLLPLFNSTFFQLHDFTHLARLAQMDTAVRDGHFPVRWTKDFAFGYGMPLFSFYGPLPSYVAQAFHLVGFSMLTSVKLLMITISLVGAFGMYELTKRMFGRTGAVISTIAFTLLPYKALDFYVRGAFNELFSISLIPWIMLGIFQLRKKNSVKWIGWTALLFALLFITHNLMTMMFAPVLYVFAWCMSVGVVQKKLYLFRFHLSLLLGVLSASFFVLPSYLEKQFTQVDLLIGGYSYYKYHFLYIRQFFIGEWGYGGSVLGLHDGMSFSFGWIAWIVTAIGILGWWLKKRRVVNKVLLGFLTLSVGVGFFLSTFKSTIIWDSVPLMAYFQFPWRFLSIPTVFMPILAGASVYLFRSSVVRRAFALLVVVLFFALNLQYFKPNKLLDNADALYYEDRDRIQAEMSGILPDYIPASMKVIQEPFLPIFELEETEAQIQVLSDRTHVKELVVTLTEPDTLIVRIAWFPNWTVYNNRQEIAFTVDEETGFIHIPLEPGEHNLTVRLEDTPLRIVSNLVSLVGLAGIVGVIVYAQHRRS